MRVERSSDGEASVFAGDTLVADVRPAQVELDLPPAVSGDAARAAEAPESWSEGHPFPTCFGCGPERDPGDGLRLFPGPVEGSDLFACPFTPNASLAEGSELAPEMVWAVLDCPSAAPAMNPRSSPAIVLGSLAVTQEAAVTVGEPHVVVSRSARKDGRKHFTDVALYSAERELKAAGRALWISLKA